MKVSIIVPIYNVEKYLPRCIDSLINQTYKDIEIILVDDGSTDSCPQICDEAAPKDSRIMVFHDSNHGIAHARNIGLDHCSGERILFVDGDDYIGLETVERMLQHSEADMVAMNRYYIDEYGKLNLVDSVYHGYYEGDEVRNLIKLKFNKDSKKIFYTSACCKLFNASYFENGANRFENKVFLGEDSIFTMNYMFHCNSIYCDDYIGYYYVRYKGSVTAPINVDTAKYWHKFEKYLSKLKEMVDEHKDKLDLTDEYLYDKIKCIHGSLNKEATKEDGGNPQVLADIVKDIDLDELMNVPNLQPLQRKMLDDFKAGRFERFMKRERRYANMKKLVKKITGSKKDA